MKSDGIVLVNKHQGITSFDVVSNLRRMLGIKRIGHCGTLDPLARGLMLICLGRATKVAQFLTGEDKRYVADVKLGSTTSTYDRFGVVVSKSDWTTVSKRKVKDALEFFIGSITQVVPPYSAIKYRGQPMYKYARKNIGVPPKKRKVVINRIELLNFDPPHVKIAVSCSKGTYIRSLAHEFGEKLGCGAHLFELCRTSVGHFRLRDAFKLNQIAARNELGRLDEKILDLSTVLPFPALTVIEQKTHKIANGCNLFSHDVAACSSEFVSGQRVSLIDSGARLLAVGEALVSSSYLSENIPNDTPVFKYIRVI